MIGGKDFIIPTTMGPSALGLVFHSTVKQWPMAVVEDAETGDVLHDLDLVAGNGHNEILIYKNAEFAEQWHEMGADESLNGTLLHVLLGTGQLTIVVDSVPSSEIIQLVSSIENAVRHSRPSSALLGNR